MKMSDKDHLIYSPLQQFHTEDGKTVKVEIYRNPDTGWSLEVVDQYGNSTIWEHEFETDQEALDQALWEFEDDGIEAFIGSNPAAAAP